MGSLILTRGNLLKADQDIICHGCNCRGGYGSGVAGQIAKQYPEAKRAYLRRYERGEWKLGDMQIVSVGKGLERYVANLATQITYGRTGVHIRYDAVRDCFTRLFTFAEGNHLSIAMPKIGSGLAGGEWQIVEGILVECLTERNVDVEVYY